MTREYIWVVILEKFWLPLGILLYFILLRKLFTTYIMKMVLTLSKEKEKEILTKVMSSFERTFQVFFAILGIYIAIHYISYMEPYYAIVDKIFRTVVVICLANGLYSLSSSSSVIFDKIHDAFNVNADRIFVPFMSRVLKFAIVGLSISIVAKEWDYDVSGFIVGLGLGGLAFALAAKDLLSNFFSGVVIITEKTFNVGDSIKIKDNEGVVEEINFRSIKIRTKEGEVILIPNSSLVNDSVKIFNTNESKSE